MTQRKLIPYAGFEPDAGYRGKRRGIDPKRALELRALGYSWQRVADQMSDENGSETVYRADSVRDAIRRYNLGIQKR